MSERLSSLGQGHTWGLLGWAGGCEDGAWYVGSWTRRMPLVFDIRLISGDRPRTSKRNIFQRVYAL